MQDCTQGIWGIFLGEGFLQHSSSQILHWYHAQLCARACSSKILQSENCQRCQRTYNDSLFLVIPLEGGQILDSNQLLLLWFVSPIICFCTVGEEQAS